MTKEDGAFGGLDADVSKMRLVTNVLFVADERAAAMAVQRASDLVGTAIVDKVLRIAFPFQRVCPQRSLGLEPST